MRRALDSKRERSNALVAQQSSTPVRKGGERESFQDHRQESATHQRFQTLADGYAEQQRERFGLPMSTGSMLENATGPSPLGQHVVQGVWSVLQKLTDVKPEEVQVVNDGAIPKVPIGIGAARQANYPQAVRNVDYGDLPGNPGTIHTEGNGGVRVDRQNPTGGFANLQAQANDPITDLQYAPNTNNAQRGTTLGTVLVDNQLLQIDNQFANHQKYVQRVFRREMLNSWAQRTKKKIRKV